MLLAEKDQRYKAVHGWLYFDFGGQARFIRFAAHSVVQNANGELIDVTPTAAGVDLYAFIPSNLSDGDFADVIDALIEAYGSSNCLDYWLP